MSPATMHYAFYTTYTTPSTASRGLFSDSLSQLILDTFPEYADLKSEIGGEKTGEKIDSDAKSEVTLELPGYSQSEISVEITHEHILSVTAQNEKRGKVSRAFYLSEDVDEAAVTAKLENGILTVSLPKLPTAKPRKVVVA